MDETSAQFWLEVIASVAILFWTVGHWLVRRTARLLESTPIESAIEVDGEPAELRRRAAATFARGEQRSTLQRLRVDAVDDESVQWTSALPVVRYRGAMTFARAGPGRTRIAWRAAAEPPVLRFARWFTLAGAVVVLGLFLLLSELALPDPNPAIRGQVFQMVQAIHVLWPPFVFVGLARMLRRQFGADLDRVAHNLPHASV
jgi:hypothetical protein